ATDNDAMLELIPPLLHRDTILLTLQNGLGNEEFLAKHFGAERVLGGLCFIAVTRHSKTEVERYDYGLVIVGELEGAAQSRTHRVADEFIRAEVKCKVTEDIA